MKKKLDPNNRTRIELKLTDYDLVLIDKLAKLLYPTRCNIVKRQQVIYELFEKLQSGEMVITDMRNNNMCVVSLHDGC